MLHAALLMRRWRVGSCKDVCHCRALENCSIVIYYYLLIDCQCVCVCVCVDQCVCVEVRACV